MNNIKIAIPGLWNHFDITKELILLMEEYPEAVKPNTAIGAVYDNFPYCPWDGGRTFNEYRHASLEDVKYIQDFLNSRDIPLRLIWTNPVVEPKHYHDRYCNLIATVCHNELNEIVVNNSGLETYLREHYPNYGYISSTTKCNNLSDSIKEMVDKDYRYVCLDYNTNHNFKVLDTLEPETKNKTEFLCNAICPPGCPARKEHYRLNGLFYINYMRSYRVPECNIKLGTLHPDTMSYANNISPDDIEQIYAPKGFSMFKLEGRTLSHIEYLINCVNYLIKPEYQSFVIADIVSRVGLL